MMMKGTKNITGAKAVSQTGRITLILLKNPLNQKKQVIIIDPIMTITKAFLNIFCLALSSFGVWAIIDLISSLVR